MNSVKKQYFKRGGVSMFLVVVSSSLMALIVASFMRIVIRDQTQASNQDLSQSAYDSAQVGVEDAKRFLAEYNRVCDTTIPNPDNANQCDRMKAALNNSMNNCHALGGYVGISSTGETLIRGSDGGGSDMNQAYTCLKIRRNTVDYLGRSQDGQSQTIPLKGVKPFNRVRISWYTKNDSGGENITLENSPNPKLPKQTDWGGRPSVLKAQFFGYGSGRSLDDLNTNFSDDGTGIDEQIYYPIGAIGSVATSTRHILPGAKRTGGADSTNRVSAVVCNNNFNRAIYACSVEVDIRVALRGGSEAYLRLTPIYKQAEFKVELMDDSGVVEFDGVQPLVDSTGRANDHFRRVESRLEVGGSEIPLPGFAIQQEGDKPLCKNFYATQLSSSLAGSGECRL